MARYDVVIVGTGAGGGTLARHLAPSGKKILLIERGGWLPREPQNVSAEEVFVNGRYVTSDMWRYENGEVFQPQVHYFVGGATKLYGAALYRLRAEDFGELRHHDGISPAWKRVRRAGRRVGRVLAAGSVHVVVALGERVVRLHLVVGDRPSRSRPGAASTSSRRG
jgi:choline dehydrogenase-like flavoprotein